MAAEPVIDVRLQSVYRAARITRFLINALSMFRVVRRNRSTIAAEQPARNRRTDEDSSASAAAAQPDVPLARV